MYKNNFTDKWNVNLVMTDTLDLVHRLFYNLDKNILIYSKLSEIQKILIDDYQLITMNQFTNANNFIVENNKITPVPKYDEDTYNGQYFTYFEIKNKLPHNAITGTINNIPLNNFLINENLCESHIINSTSKDKNSISKNKYDNIFLTTYINDNNNCIEEIQYLPQVMHDYHKALKLLNKGGNLFVNLNYYYHEPNIIFLQYILSFFDSVEYINNPLVSNKIGHNLIKFSNYSGVKTIELKLIRNLYNKDNSTKSIISIINNFYCNKQQINGKIIQTLFNNTLDDNFVEYLNKIYKQQNKYLKTLIKRVNFIDYKKIFRHLNNQIDTAIGWCEKHNIALNEIYKENKVIMKPYIIKKYFKSEKGVDLSKIKMTSDSLYSVSMPNIADEMSKIIKNAMPNAKIIIDGTANVGGNTLSFSSYFDHVISVEINKKTFDVLQNNVKTYNRKNVELINDDFLNIVDALSADVIFMDPPWTGTFYKMYDKMDLYLSEINIIDLIPKLKCKIVALKLPMNYNIRGLLEKVSNLEIFKIYGIILILIKK
jgi:hypothetical protein